MTVNSFGLDQRAPLTLPCFLPLPKLSSKPVGEPNLRDLKINTGIGEIAEMLLLGQHGASLWGRDTICDVLLKWAAPHPWSHLTTAWAGSGRHTRKNMGEKKKKTTRNKIKQQKSNTNQTTQQKKRWMFSHWFSSLEHLALGLMSISVNSGKRAWECGQC